MVKLKVKRKLRLRILLVIKGVKIMDKAVLILINSMISIFWGERTMEKR